MSFIRPHWQAPASIQVVSTTRIGGVSGQPYAAMNLGLHVGDEPSAVLENRRLLQQQLSITNIQWLEQVHGVDSVMAEADQTIRTADACWTDKVGLACAVMTADCLPVVITDGNKVAAVHAGWRGLCAGVLDNALQAFDLSQPDEIHIWLGPAISQAAFEVGAEVREAFCQQQPEAEAAFIKSAHDNRWMANLYALARIRLHFLGLQQVSGGEHCTFTEENRFYSYRREATTGRQATLIWKTVV